MRSLLKQTYRWTVNTLPPPQSLALQFYRHHRSFLNIKKPKTFSEKVQHRKVYERDSRFRDLADKVLVKDYVAKEIGAQFIIPTLWSGKSLPPVELRNWPIPFIIKPNHASDWNIFVRTEAELDWLSIQKTCESFISTPFYEHLQEGWYNEIDRQILVEPLLGPPEGINDYKFFVFNGKVKYIQVDTERQTDHKRAFYDCNWSPQYFSSRYPLEKRAVERPPHLLDMIAAAEKLGSPFNFVRVDLYDLEDGPRFGELTFTPSSGFAIFSPVEYDRLLGDLWPIKQTA